MLMVHVAELNLTLSNSLGHGIFMLMDILASEESSPFIDVDYLWIEAGESEVITATTVTRINNIIRRYELCYLSLKDVTMCMWRAFCLISGRTPDIDLYQLPRTRFGHGDVESVTMELGVWHNFTLLEPKLFFDWYLASLAAVPPDSNLREITLSLQLLARLEATDLGSQGVWGILDSALSGANLQLDALIIGVNVLPPISPTDTKTRGLMKALQTWLMETCFPKVTDRYLENKKVTAEGARTSSRF